MTITITEALAEIKTISNRISKKRSFFQGYIARPEGLKDPLEKDGGSVEVIKRERQAVKDLNERIINLRRAIQQANDTTTITINGETRSISEWLTWKRDVAPGERTWLQSVINALKQLRDDAQRKGNAVISATAVAGTDPKPNDFVVNIDEKGISDELENIEDTLGQLDGQLSLKNATVFITD